MKARLVFDATPLIHLSKAGLASLLVSMEGEKFTAPAVVREVVGERKGEFQYADAAITSSLIERGVLTVKAPRADGVRAILRIHGDIHQGEAEVLALAKEVRGVAVTDDRVARGVARIEGVRVEGTYGVVLRGVAKGRLSREEGEEALGRLVSSGWRCDSELYAALLKSLREISHHQQPVR